MIDVETESEYTMEESLIDVINPAINVRLGDIGFPPSYQHERWKKKRAHIIPCGKSRNRLHYEEWVSFKQVSTMVSSPTTPRC